MLNRSSCFSHEHQICLPHQVQWKGKWYIWWKSCSSHIRHVWNKFHFTQLLYLALPSMKSAYHFSDLKMQIHSKQISLEVICRSRTSKPNQMLQNELFFLKKDFISFHFIHFVIAIFSLWTKSSSLQQGTKK